MAEAGYYQNIPTGTAVTNAVQAVKDIEELNAFAAKYKAEKDATGALVRDAADVDKEVKKATLKVYGDAAGVTITEDTQTIAQAEAAIKALSVNQSAADLDFAKAVAKATLENAKADIIDDYYALEAAKVEANYAKVLEKIEAAKTVAEVNTAINGLDLGKNIDDADTVDSKVNYTSGAAKAALDAVKAYVTYSNSGKTVLDAGYIIASDQDIKDALNKIYGEARCKNSW